MTVNVSKPAINVREKLAELDKPTGIAGEAMLRADNVPQQAELLGYRNRNVIINGSFDIAQRGTSFTGVTGGYTLDRWSLARSSTATLDIEQSTETPDGYSKSMKLTVNAADSSVASSDYVILGQSVEGLNCQQFAANTSNAKAITVQFWVRSSVTGTYICELYGDLSPNLSRAYTIDQADTWKKVVLVYTPPTNVTFSNDNGRGFLMQFWLLAGSTYSGGSALKTSWNSANNTRAVGQTNFVATSGNEIYFTGVQVVAGNYPEGLPFEHRSYGEELALCQRYYWKSDTVSIKGYYFEGVAQSGTYAHIEKDFPVTMRAEPTASLVGSATQNGCSGVSIHGTTVHHVRISANGNAASLSRTYFYNNSGSYVEADAEL
jgi:hypothetical protein